MKVKAHRDATEVLQPCEQPLNLPPSLVAPERSAILRPSFLPVRLVRRDHLNALLLEFCVERVRVVSLIADQSLGPLSGKNLGESFRDKGDFMRASRRRVDGERKTRAVCHRHELRTFAPLGLSHPESPFLATMKVASMKHSDKSKSPRSLRSCARASSTLRSVPSLTQSWNLRWQVWYGGNRSGKSCHRAPLRSIQRTPFITSRVSLHGLPRPSSRRGNSGIRGSISTHCSSVSSSRRAMPKS
jgi:hypothetical protein